MDIYLGGRNVSSDFAISINSANKKFSIKRNNAPYGQYKVIVTYGNDKKTDEYLNNFFVTHGIIGEEIEYDYDKTTFAFSPGRDLEFYSFILPQKNFVIYTTKLSGSVSFLQTKTSVYSQKNTSIPTLSYQITNGESCVSSYDITSNSGYTLSYNFNFEYYADASLQPVTVYYDLGGGVNHPKNYAKELANSSTPLTLYAPTRDGYTFDGWYLDYANGCKKIDENDGVYSISWQDIHHMGESPTLNASSYYKKYYNNSNTLFVYARWKETTYHSVDLTINGNGKSIIDKTISVCADDSVRYIFTPDSGWCLANLSVNGIDLSSSDLIEVMKYGLLLKGVDTAISIVATFEEGVYLSLNYGENIKTVYIIGSLNGVEKKFYNGDFIPAEYFSGAADIIKPRKQSLQLASLNTKDEKEDLPPITIIRPGDLNFTLAVEVFDETDDYFFALDNASAYTPMGNNVYQKSITINKNASLEEISVGSATKKIAEKTKVTYKAGSYITDHYISTDINASSGEKDSILCSSGQTVYLFIKPTADNAYYKYKVPNYFVAVGNGWYRKAYFINADNPDLGKISVYRNIQTYTVTWLNWDGSLLYSEEYQAGEIPVFDIDRLTPSSTPTRPDEGVYSFVFTGWNKNIKVVMSNTYTATYQTVLKEFTISVETTENGSVVSNDESNTLTYEDKKTYTFTSSVGYKIKEVFVNGVSVGAIDSYTFSGVTSDQTLRVEFEKIKYSVSVICGENGSANCAETTQIEHGASFTVNFTPDDGYKIKNVMVDGVSVGVVCKYCFESVEQNHRIEVEYELDLTPIIITPAIIVTIGGGLALALGIIIKRLKSH